MRQAGEPSVEEILSSIKKVIARDNRVDSGRVDSGRVDSGRIDSRRAQTAKIEPQERDDVLRFEARRKPRHDNPARDNDVLDLGEVAAQVLGDDLVRGTSAADDDFTDHGADDIHDDSTDQKGPLINDAAVSSMRESLAALAMLAEEGARPQIVRSGETSLEGLVRELLRPKLAEWLDQHLPAMVERLVAAEIARIVRKKS